MGTFESSIAEKERLSEEVKNHAKALTEAIQQAHQVGITVIVIGRPRPLQQNSDRPFILSIVDNTTPF